MRSRSALGSLTACGTTCALRVMVRREGARPLERAPGVAGHSSEGWPRSAESQLLHVSRKSVLARLERSDVRESREHQRAAYLMAVLLGAQRVRGSVSATPISHGGMLPSAADIVAIDPGALAALSGLTRAASEHAIGSLLTAGVITRDAALMTSER